MGDKLQVGVFASGRGSDLQSLMDASAAGKLDADVAVVIANRAEAYALERARAAGIPAFNVRVGRNDSPDYDAADDQHARILADHGVGLVCLAGYMRRIGPRILAAFPAAIMNIHPALLPAFPGVEVQWTAVEYGVRVSGCTVHFADEEFDRGPIIIQAAVPVLQDDDGAALAARILECEHRIYPQAVQWFAQGRLRIEGRRVVVEGAMSPTCEGGVIYSPGLEI
jgi:phosphoribosylglycinamide formyltransferase-1